MYPMLNKVLGKQTVLAMEGTPFTSPVEIDSMYDHPSIPAGYSVMYGQKVSLNWSLGMEAKTWGIKGLTLFVPNQSVSIELESEESMENMTIEVELKDLKVEEPETFGAIFPKQIGYWKGQWTVTF